MSLISDGCNYSLNKFKLVKEANAKATMQMRQGEHLRAARLMEPFSLAIGNNWVCVYCKH